MPTAVTPSARLVHVPLVVFKVYVVAARKLARIMGSSAPDAVQLIHHELEGRRPASIAEAYLISIEWTGEPAARPPSPRLRLPLRRLTTRPSPPKRVERLASPLDPSRN